MTIRANRFAFDGSFLVVFKCYFTLILTTACGRGNKIKKIRKRGERILPRFFFLLFSRGDATRTLRCREFILTNEEFILLAARSRFEFNWQKRDFEMLHSYLH